MKKIICLLLSVIFIMSCLTTAFTEKITNDDEYLYATRGEAFDCVLGIINFDDWFNERELYQEKAEKLDSVFSDIKEYNSHGYSGWMTAVAVEIGVIKGYSDGTLRPKDKITRGEMATLLYRASKFDETVPEELFQMSANYQDISDWNREGIDFCYKRGIMIGYGDSFGCNNYLTILQLEIVNRRYGFRMTSFEKHLALDIAGVSPINMSKVIESANIPELIKPYNEFAKESQQRVINLFQVYMPNLPENSGYKASECPMFLVTLPQNCFEQKSYVYRDGRFQLCNENPDRIDALDGYLYYIDGQDLLNKKYENMYRMRVTMTRNETVTQFRPIYLSTTKWDIVRGEKEPIPQDYFYNVGR